MTIKELRKLLRGLKLNEQLLFGSDRIIKGEKSYGLKVRNDESDYTFNEFKIAFGYKEKDIIEIAIMEELIQK